MKRTFVIVAAVAAVALVTLTLALPGFAAGFIRGFSTTSGMVWLGL
jgi:hypothetical protein